MRSFATATASTVSSTVPLDESWARRDLVIGVRDYKSLPSVTKLLVEHLRTHDDARLTTGGVSDRLTVVRGKKD